MTCLHLSTCFVLYLNGVDLLAWFMGIFFFFQDPYSYLQALQEVSRRTSLPIETCESVVAEPSNSYNLEEGRRAPYSQRKELDPHQSVPPYQPPERGREGFFSLLSQGLRTYLQKNGYIVTAVQKAGISGVSGCFEHAI